MVSVMQLLGALLSVFPPSIQAILSVVVTVGLLIFLFKLIKLILDAIPFV